MALSEEERERVVDAFAELRSVDSVASALDIDRAEVREVLSDPEVLFRAKSLLLNSIGVEFYGVALERAMSILRKSQGKDGDKVAAMRFIHSILESEKPKRPTGRPPKAKTAPPPSLASVVQSVSNDGNS